MTIISDDEWKQKHLLTSMGLHMDPELPLVLSVLEAADEFGSWPNIWIQNCHWALAELGYGTKITGVR